MGICVAFGIQDEMLGSVKAAGGADWSVLVMDYQTTRVMSSACRISEILDYGVSRAPRALQAYQEQYCGHVWGPCVTINAPTNRPGSGRHLPLLVWPRRDGLAGRS